jgi:aryl-alcohol dehydrogenase-like predicted oxidoreductase
VNFLADDVGEPQLAKDIQMTQTEVKRPLRVLDFDECVDRWKGSRRSWDRMIANRQGPPVVKISARRRGVLETAIDHGITIIDTAPVYGFGRAEEIVGRALWAGGNRDRVLIATKCGLSWRGNKVFRDATAARIQQEVEGSLRRLRTDRIDLYQVHWPDPLVPIEEIAGAMSRLFTQGKIRAIGVSNFDAGQMDKFRHVAPLHATQPPYNLFERAIDADVLPYAREAGLVVLAYGALVAVSSAGGYRRRLSSPATTCAATTRNFDSRAALSISPR